MRKESFMRSRRFLKTLLLGVTAIWTLFFALTASPSAASVQPYPLESLRPGQVGEARTVIRGEEIVSFPVTILSILPRKGSPSNLILVRAEGPVIDKTGGIAAGMSGSPVFIDGKLVGAIGYGWNFSDHRLGLVTPIEDMRKVWEWPDGDVLRLPDPVSVAAPSSSEDLPACADLVEVTCDDEALAGETSGDEAAQEKNTPLLADGLSGRAARAIGSRLGVGVETLAGTGGTGDLPVQFDPDLKPGDAIGVMLAWGDVSLGATGTLTELDEEGRFLAFAHPFLNRGAVRFPVTRAYVHGVIPSIQSPFKIGEPRAIIGTVTQDRPQAIGGKLGIFAPSLDVSVTFRDRETGTEKFKRFHIVNDPFLVAQILPDAVMGILDELWGQIGEGTLESKVTLEGRGLNGEFTRSNIFFSDEDVVKEALGEAETLVGILALNPFREIFPLGIRLDYEVTRKPEVLFIEELTLDEKKVRPGEKVKGTFRLRPYRGKPISRTFTLQVPEKAAGPCEVVVRGGGIAEPGQESLLEGWRSINDLEQLLREVNAAEANNEVIIELRYPSTDPVQGLEEEQELLSEQKNRRMKEGSLRIFKSNFYVEGLMRRSLQVLPPEKKSPAGQ
jgi:hypothetical protein